MLTSLFIYSRVYRARGDIRGWMSQSRAPANLLCYCGVTVPIVDAFNQPATDLCQIVVYEPPVNMLNHVQIINSSFDSSVYRIVLVVY